MANRYKSKISWHSHIKGLDLKSVNFSNSSNCGLIGQVNARMSIRMVIDLIKQNNIPGQVIMITGKSGSGKTAIGLAIGKELGSSIPFSLVNASEFCFLNSKKTGLLVQKFRKAIGIRIIENIEFYEGEVTEIEYNSRDETKFDTYPCLIIGLKTSDGSLRVKLQESLYEIFIQNRVNIGDIIYIEPEKCIIKIIGKSLNFYQEDEICKSKYVSIPVGKVFKKKFFIQDITLSDLDIVNSKPFDCNNSKIENATVYLRQEVDKLVSVYLQSKKALLIYGVLFIDEAHTLGFDGFCFLTKLLDSKFSPLIILSTNRTTLIDLKNLFSSNLPLSFLDRCLTIRTKSYKNHEMAQIVTVKAKNEGFILTGKSILKFTNISESTSLRFSILLSLASGLVSSLLNKFVIGSSVIQFVNFIFLFYRESQKLYEKSKTYLKISRIN